MCIREGEERESDCFLPNFLATAETAFPELSQRSQTSMERFLADSKGHRVEPGG